METGRPCMNALHGTKIGAIRLMVIVSGGVK